MTTDERTTGTRAAAALEYRLAVAEETLRALLVGSVDTIMLDAKQGGKRIYTLETAEHPYRRLVERMSEGAALVDADGLVVYANHRLATLIGAPLGRVLGRPFLDWLDEPDRAPFLQRLASADSEGHDELTLLRVDRGRVPVLVGVSVTEEPDGRLHCLTIVDLTQQKAQTQRVHQLNKDLEDRIAELSKVNRELHSAEDLLTFRTLHDPLTGLPNRTLLVDRIGQALRTSARGGTSTALLFLDLDRFKEINDAFGHHQGDEVLIQVGTRLTSVVRDIDTVARVAGDEFAVLLRHVGDTADAVAVAKKLQAALETPFHFEGVNLEVEASIGIVVSTSRDQDAASLLQRADFAMYAAKMHHLGVSVFDPSRDERSPAKLALFGDLHRALDRGEIVVHYQPEIKISTGEVVGVEALVRWAHPERGMILPDDFIPFAEHTGLIGPLARCVLDTALAQARNWSDDGWSLPVSVNLSVRNLLDDGLPDQIADLLATHGVGAEMLAIEVTESAVMIEPERSRRVLERLAALGLRISIDDFGSGYTSLSELRILPISELKIDRSFITTMTKDNRLLLIVRSLIDLGHALDLTIVAEGVESKKVLNALAALGCDTAQGYYLSRPMTAAAFDIWYADRRIAASKSPGDATAV